MPMSRLAPPLARPPTDPVVALRSCHERIRMFTAGLERVAALPDLADARVPAAAAQAHRYFTEGLPLHMADEDLSLAPRLLAARPESGALLADLERDHVAIEACLGTLLPLLHTLAGGGAIPHTLLRVTVAYLSGLMLPHLAREEEELFPLCERLTAEDRLAVGREIVGRRA